MREAGQRQFTRARAAADLFFRFQYKNGSPSASKNDCGCQAVRAGTNDHAVVFVFSCQSVVLSYDRKRRSRHFLIFWSCHP
jgi:hypothetical protein